jgi:hypothetical protein
MKVSATNVSRLYSKPIRVIQLKLEQVATFLFRSVKQVHSGGHLAALEWRIESRRSFMTDPEGSDRNLTSLQMRRSNENSSSKRLVDVISITSAMYLNASPRIKVSVPGTLVLFKVFI